MDDGGVKFGNTNIEDQLRSTAIFEREEPERVLRVLMGLSSGAIKAPEQARRIAWTIIVLLFVVSAALWIYSQHIFAGPRSNFPVPPSGFYHKDKMRRLI